MKIKGAHDMLIKLGGRIRDIRVKKDITQARAGELCHIQNPASQELKPARAI